MANTWSKEIKDRAYELYSVHDYKLEEVANEFDIPFPTVKSWHNRYDWAERKKAFKEQQKKLLEAKLNEALTDGKVEEHLRLIEQYEALQKKLMNKALEQNMNEIQIIEMKDFKAFIDSLSKVNADYIELRRIKEHKQEIEVSGHLNNPVSDLTEEELKAIISLSGGSSG